MDKQTEIPKKECCHNAECIEKIKKQLPPISNTTKKEEVEWEIKALPGDWRK